MIEWKNARITHTSMGIEDHGIFTCFLYLDYGNSTQGFGGYPLDVLAMDKKGRVGGSWGMNFIMQTMKAVGVDQWEDLPGKYIRVEIEGGKINGITGILGDKCFYPGLL